MNWDDQWPIKPDIVLEGGNLVVDETGAALECEDLSLLSTSHRFHDYGYFSFINETSAATAQAAWCAAQILAEYPDFWPETIRALMVHSSRWPEQLKAQFMKEDTKTAYKRLLRICGYGVPDLKRALYSASNSLTIVSQADIQPFCERKTNEMHLYELPWPTEVLRNLPHDIEVEMRVTLSYFIEPGPGEIGWKDRYRYPSHLLRFDVIAPEESQDQFVKRLSSAMRADEKDGPGTRSPSEHWVIGSQARDKGSIHSDIWQGTAAQLAESNLIAVSPRIGWWRERGFLKRQNSKTRYSLVVSIDTPEQSVDLYTPVANQVRISAPVDIVIT